MNLGEILDRTFQIYRSRFLVFFCVAALPALAMCCIHIADSLWLHANSLFHPVGQPGIFMWNFVVGLGFYHISSIFVVFAQPAHTKLAAAFILGESSSIASALRFAAARWLRFLWITFLMLSACLLIPEIVLIGLFTGIGILEEKAGLLNGGANWPFVLILTVPTVAGIYLFLRIGACLSLTMPAAALENLSAFRSLRRSWVLSRGSRTRIMFTWLALFIASWILWYVFQLLLWQLVYLLCIALHLAPLAPQLYVPVVYTMFTAFSAILGPIYPIALTLFYYDQRIRQEGYDIEKMMESAGMIATTTPSIGAKPAASPVAEEAHS
jgi:hypothetical protein